MPQPQGYQIGKNWLALSPSRFPLPPFFPPSVPLHLSPSLSLFSVPDARSAESVTSGSRGGSGRSAAQRSASLGAAPGLCAPAAAAHRDRRDSQLLGSVARCPQSSPWVLSGFASSLDLVYTWKNKATCPTNHPGCKGLSPRSEPCTVGCLGSLCAAAPVMASAGAGDGGAGRPGASWGAAARRPGARPRPPGLHWIRPEKVEFPETSMRPTLRG